MATLISALAVGVVALFSLFILKRVIGFLLRRRSPVVPLHEDLADVAEDIAGASKVAATLASVAAFFAAPAGLLALAAAVGLAPKPLIVILLPALLAFAAGAIALSALAKLYAKSVRKRKKRYHSEA
jgi:hypothetical protein